MSKQNEKIEKEEVLEESQEVAVVEQKKGLKNMGPKIKKGLKVAGLVLLGGLCFKAGEHHERKKYDISDDYDDDVNYEVVENDNENND